jgi:hypothetical protein
MDVVVLSSPLYGATVQVERGTPMSIVTTQNVGAGAGVYKELVASVLSLRSLVAGTNITITQNTNDITITGKNLVAGSNVTLTPSGNDITISAGVDPGSYVPLTRTISTTAPLAGGGALSGDLTLSIPVASGGSNGYLSATDWTAFNGAVSAVATKVGTSRAINTTAPITGGGDLSTDRTIAMAAATTGVNGYLTSTDWNTFNSKMPSSIAFVTVVDDNYTLGLTDQNKIIEMNSATPKIVYIPLNSSVAFPIGTQILVARYGSGALTIQGVGGVSIYSADGFVAVAKQFGGVALVKVGTNNWYLFGLLG